MRNKLVHCNIILKIYKKMTRFYQHIMQMQQQNVDEVSGS